MRGKVCIGWLLLSRWVHDNLHMVTGLRPRSLLVTLMLAGAALACAFVTAASRQFR